MGIEGSTHKFLQTVNGLKDKIKPYQASFECALAYVVELDSKIVQLCIILQPLKVGEQYTELYYEPRMFVKIYAERLSIEEVYNSLEQFTSQGVITLSGTLKKFVYSPSDLGSIQLLEKATITVLGNKWSSWQMKAWCNQTLEKIFPTFDFSRFSSILREERGESSFTELINDLTHLPSLEIGPNICPGITVLAPIYARISRCGLIEDRIRLYVKIKKDLLDNPYLSLNILKFNSQGQPSLLKLGLSKMKVSSHQDFVILYYEIAPESLERVEFNLKDHEGLSRSRGTIILTWDTILKKKADDFPRKYLSLYVRKSGHLVFLLVFLLLIALSAYAIWFYMNNKILPDPIAAVTVAMTIATVLMAYVSKKGLDIPQHERLKPLAQEAINDFLPMLRSSIQGILRGVDEDEQVSISPEYLEPKPHLLMVTYYEAPSLLRKLSKLLRSMFNYNVSIDLKGINRLKSSAEEVLKGIDDLETKLSQKYFIKRSLT